MSQENVEVVRKLFEIYNERSFAEHVELIDPEMVWDFSRVELPDGMPRGRAEFPRFIEAWDEGFESEQMEPRELIDCGDRIVATVHHSGRGKASGIEVEQTFAMVWTLGDGRAVRMDMYPSRAEALQAVGLSE